MGSLKGLVSLCLEAEIQQFSLYFKWSIVEGFDQFFVSSNHSFDIACIWLIWHLGFGMDTDPVLSFPLQTNQRAFRNVKPIWIDPLGKYIHINEGHEMFSKYTKVISGKLSKTLCQPIPWVSVGNTELNRPWSGPSMENPMYPEVPKRFVPDHILPPHEGPLLMLWWVDPVWFVGQCSAGLWILSSCWLKSKVMWSFVIWWLLQGSLNWA